MSPADAAKLAEIRALCASVADAERALRGRLCGVPGAEAHTTRHLGDVHDERRRLLSVRGPEYVAFLLDLIDGKGEG
jgi:hypothetical protein